ncbi:GNAT family N-acetyltransferase [Euzebya tangerina]|uniref:GNAT family N-acetyltransferase n=1 Tax=Euzebya tangerina TaxID=591198 RepID=UPI00196A4D11|nr:GNAT family N-acetyltransferase [Euzebya tangerina]
MTLIEEPVVDKRPVAAHDRSFLAQVYASTRTSELDRTPWTPQQKQAFLTQQFEAQDDHYRTHYGDAEWSVLLVDAEPVGRLYLDRRAEEFRIIDIAILPEHRGRGIGTRVLRAVIDEAEHAGVPVSIHVEAANPAMRLYERLGFEAVEDRPPYRFLRRAADGPGGPVS